MSKIVTIKNHAVVVESVNYIKVFKLEKRPVLSISFRNRDGINIRYIEDNRRDNLINDLFRLYSAFDDRNDIIQLRAEIENMVDYVCNQNDKE